MPPNFRIDLVQTAPNQPYYSGSTITGNLLLDVDEPKSYNQIVVEFSGRSFVQWSETHVQGAGNYQQTVTYTFTSTEAYVDLVAPLWKKQQTPDGKLAPGQYSWPFSFTVPPTAPSSFEGTVGNIRYTLVGKILTGLLKFNLSVEVRIPVQQLVKITDPLLLRPWRKQVQKRLCCLCCASGPIVLTVALPKTGFCIGKPFQLHSSLENGSNRRGLIMKASITQRVVYHAQGNRNWNTKTLLNIASEAIESQSSRNWDPTITIPTEGVNIIHGPSCSNIKVTFTLNVVCRIPRALNLSMPIPIELGNCRDQQQTAPAVQPEPQQAAAAYPPPLQPGPPPLASYQPPPYIGLAGVNAVPPATAGPEAGSNIGCSAKLLSDFPPPEQEETLTHFSAAKIQKGSK